MQTALCYLEVIRTKIPELVEKEKMGIIVPIRLSSPEPTPSKKVYLLLCHRALPDTNH